MSKSTFLIYILSSLHSYDIAHEPQLTRVGVLAQITRTNTSYLCECQYFFSSSGKPSNSRREMISAIAGSRVCRRFQVCSLYHAHLGKGGWCNVQVLTSKLGRILAGYNFIS